jgi:hypothetical protein
MDNRTWLNAWGINELDWSGLVRRGDSGAPVTVEGGEALGHVVAAYGTVRPTRRCQMALVQDINVILDFMTNFGMTSPQIYLDGAR